MGEERQKAMNDAEIGALLHGTTWDMQEWAWDPKSMRAQQRTQSLIDQPLAGTTQQTLPNNQSPPKPTKRVTRGVKLSWQIASQQSPTDQTNDTKTQSHKHVICQAAGCNADMSQHTFYCRRNSICPDHIKADSYIHRTDNVQLRFCQKCGRPHALSEFDGDKHSCRFRLEKHNALRRKNTNKRKGKSSSRAANTTTTTKGDASKRQRTQHHDDDNNTDTNTPLPSQQQQQQQQQIEKQNNTPTNNDGLFVNNTSADNTIIDDDVLLNELSSWLIGNLSDTSTDEEQQQQQHSSVDQLALSDILKHSNMDSDMNDDEDAFDLACKLMMSSTHNNNDGVVAENTNDNTAVTGLTTTTSSLSSMITMIASNNTTTTTNVLPIVPSPTQQLRVPQLISFEAQVASVSLKLFGCTPAELPSNLRDQVISFLGGMNKVASVETYLRPGCVHLTVQTVLDTTEHTDDATSYHQHAVEQQQSTAAAPLTLESFVQRMLTQQQHNNDSDNNNSNDTDIWMSKNMLVQLGNDAALIHKGKIIQQWSMLDVSLSTTRGRAFPVITTMTPAIVFVDTNNNNNNRQCTALEFVVQGMNILQNDCEIVARFHGSYIGVETAYCGDCKCSASIRSCCRHDNNDGSSVSEDWEDTCCGCCISKLADMPLQSSATTTTIEGDDNDNNNNNNNASKPSCCSSRQQQQPHTKDVSLQRIKLSINASEITKPGLLYIDIFKGPLTALRSAQVLIVDDESIARELMSSPLLQKDHQLLQRWISALGIIFEHVGDKEKLRFSFIERIATSLLYEAICAGFLCLAQRLHALLQSEVMLNAEKNNGSVPQQHFDIGGLLTLDRACKMVTFQRVTAIAARRSLTHNNDSNNNSINATTASKLGLSLLHCAVISQNTALVQLVLQWAADVDAPWQIDIKGPMDLTPMHLAVVAQDPSIAAEMILTLISYHNQHHNSNNTNGDSINDNKDTAITWISAKDSNGLSPADYAIKVGRWGLLEVFGVSCQPPDNNTQQRAVVNNNAARNNEVKAVLEQPSTPRRCKCTGSCPCSTAAEPCASCISLSDDELGCCGSIDGKCSCCASNQEREEVVVRSGCCASKK